MPLKTEFDNLAGEVIARCHKLSSFSEDAHSTRRTFLSPPMRDVHREITPWLEPLGTPVTVDAIGNLRAIYPANQSHANEPAAPRLLIGSHLDTVPNAGAYDGILGVVLAVALLQQLHGRRLPFAIEVVGFSEEEGVRFRLPFLGSRALVGRLDASTLETCDPQGISIRSAIEVFGLNPQEIPQARLTDEVFAYLEFHIEQGPLLEKLNLPLAVVDSIAGQTRLELRFLGRSNHAGTTPMDLRFDAMAGAAEWIVAVEQHAKHTPGLVATVGSVQTIPGAGNVIAGEAVLTLDVRHQNDNIRTCAVDDMIHLARQIAQRRGLLLNSIPHLNQSAVPMDSFLCGQIEAAIRRTGCAPHRMSSGAGHDAMVMAEKVPSAMIFLRTPGGVSHDPAETVLVDDVAKAIECGMHLLDQLASSPDFFRKHAEEKN